MSAELEKMHDEFVALDARWRSGEPWLQSRVRDAYNRWWRQSCAEGRRPDALRTDTSGMTTNEIFAAKTVQGVDHVYWVGGRSIRLENGRTRKVEVWVMEQHLGREINDYREVVERTCKTLRCVRISHLQIRPKYTAVITQAEAIARLRAAARKLGRTPTTKDRHCGAPDPTTLIALFGSRMAALDAAGLESPYSHEPRPQHLDEELLEAVRVRARELGRAPRPGEWEANHWSPSYATIRRRFGLWPVVLKKAGVE